MPATSPLLNMPLYSHAERVAISLAKAHERLEVGMPALRMDGATGVVKAIQAVDGAIIVTVEMPDGTAVREMAGLWHGRSAL